ncbi:MAG: AbgT family transporter [Bacteroidaceae bacterium]|nr:AbgT family transporter [Bacteroidaceae bacterium]
MTNNTALHTRLAHGLIISLFCSMLLLILGSWVLSMVGVSVNNIISSEGLRWFFRQRFVPLETQVISVVLLIMICLGAITDSGLWKDLCLLVNRNQRPLNMRQRRALFAVLVLLIFSIFAFIFLIMSPSAILLSVTGHLWPSPFFDGIIRGFVINILFLSIVYGISSGHMRTFSQTLSLLYIGIIKFAPWIIVTLLSLSLYSLCLYVFS